MQKLSSKIVAIAISLLMIISIGGAFTSLIQNVHAQINLPTEAYINVDPNPCGVGQAVTIDFWLGVPLLNSAYPAGMTIYVTPPGGTTTIVGTFIGDETGGTHTTYTPTATGTYSFYWTFAGQNLTTTGYIGDYEEPATSPTETLTVTNTPATQEPFTPLPTTYWQSPVNAENVQNWYAITGAWLGLGPEPFGATGLYNGTCAQDSSGGDYNPYTTIPTTGHILWTTPWCEGGIAGGSDATAPSAGTESGHYWVTCQYEPKWAPVVINGIMYSTWYTTTTGYSNGIRALNLYTGQQLYIINTTNPLVCGMVTYFQTPNQYGYVGPYIWTTGTLPASVTGGNVYPAEAGKTEWNMYDALTGNYICSIVNGTGDSVGSGALYCDPNGNLMLIYDNATAGTQIIHPNAATTTTMTTTGPSICLFNFTLAMQQSGQWSVAYNHQYLWNNGIMNEVTVISPISLAQNGIGSDTLVMGSNGGISSEFGGGQTAGWWYLQGYNIQTLQLMWTDNNTETPYTRTSSAFGDGVLTDINQETNVINGYSLWTGALLWTNTLTGFNGAPANPYDTFDIYTIVGNGVEFIYGFGGDMWAVSLTNGAILWYTNTTAIFGSPGLETPYGTWPLWIFGNVVTNGQLIIYSMGHNYDPPLFHDAQEFALNCTTGQLVWSVLGFDTIGTELSYGIKLGLNAYDGQLYAYGQGPSATTVTAPDVGVTTATPVTISGTVMDVSAGASQQAVKADFPNGVPCISDADQGQFMATVYEQQPMPTNMTGVPVTLTDIDPNGNSYTIGTVTSNAFGTYSLTWTPTIKGSYTIIATFAGSGAYYGSYADTYLYAGSPPATAPPTSPPVTGLASQSSLTLGIVAVIIVILIAIAIVGVLLLRKKP